MKKILYRQIQSFKKKTFLSRKKNKCFRLCSHKEKKEKDRGIASKPRERTQERFEDKDKVAVREPRDRLRSRHQSNKRKKEKEKREKVSLTHSLTHSHFKEKRKKVQNKLLPKKITFFIKRKRCFRLCSQQEPRTGSKQKDRHLCLKNNIFYQEKRRNVSGFVAIKKKKIDLCVSNS